MSKDSFTNAALVQPSAGTDAELQAMLDANAAAEDTVDVDLSELDDLKKKIESMI